MGQLFGIVVRNSCVGQLLKIVVKNCCDGQLSGQL